MADLNRNNLYKSSSPYLLQHTSNPVWWQEWSDDVIKYAVSVNKPLLVSVGYATCHWCHVMASEAFSDKNTSLFLNKHFICIKVDREQRPDIDQFLMDFINKQNGRGGWPLNVFLTPTLHPVFALTYAPVFSGDSLYSFLSIAEQVVIYLEKNSNDIPPYIPVENKPSVAEADSLLDTLSAYFDPENGGFGSGQKFPSHSTLLYLLYQLSVDDSPSIRTICSKTLDVMSLRGLNDHLQGGIFRYCVDNEWTIPHFEKMLYDQAMVLWTYSLAYKVMGKDEYKTMANNIIRCLDESFEENGLYISAHDADTEHEEGTTYIWSYEELAKELSSEEFSLFSETYFIYERGNFEGKNHLLRKNDTPMKAIEEKLLFIRKKRKQPSTDNKILSGINALVAIALAQAGRLLGKPYLEEKASFVVINILKKFWDGKNLGHSYFNGILQEQGFLSDAAALLTAISMLYERNDGWSKLMSEMATYVESFKEGDRWCESRAEDFQTVYASWLDHPVPSGVSLAEFGLTRVALQNGKNVPTIQYVHPFQSDFYNINCMMSNGYFHIITSPQFISWNLLPANSIQLRGEAKQDCYMGTCRVPDNEALWGKRTF